MIDLMLRIGIRTALWAPLALLWLGPLPERAQAQGRQSQAQAPTPAPPPAPARTTAPGGRGGGMGPAIGGEIDETPAVTHHRIQVDGKALAYTATAAQMPLKNVAGETEAHMFYVAYTLDGADAAKRPLTFCFNGGPGSASLWVHMGGMGPRSPRLMPDGSMAPPPYQIHDNPNTWLDRTDLVFIDAPGTGYSRPKDEEVARRMEGVQGDLQAFGDFIRLYLERNNRELSPLFLAGESYGTFRAAGLANRWSIAGSPSTALCLSGLRSTWRPSGRAPTTWSTSWSCPLTRPMPGITRRPPPTCKARTSGSF